MTESGGIHAAARASQSLDAGKSVQAGFHPLATVGVLGAGLFLVVFDSLSVAAALPTIGADLDLRPTHLQWVVNTYSLIIAGLLLAGGRCADLFGRRRVLLSSLGLLAAGTAVAGVAVNLPMLLIGRCLQGAAAACALPAALALTGALFPREPWRSRAFGVMSVAGGTAGVAGAVLGGILTSAVGWHWIFLGVLPVNVAAFLATWRFVPADARRARTGRHLDLPGAALGTVSLLGVVFALGHIESAGILAVTVLVPLAVGLTLLAGFLVWEGRAPEPLVDVHLLRSRRLAGSCIGIGAQSSVHTAVVVIGSLHLQSIHGMSAAAAGVALSPALIATSLGSIVAGRLLPTWGARRIAVVALPVAAIAMAGLAVFALWPNYALAVLPWFVLQGLFNSAIYVALSSEAVGEAAEEAADAAVDDAIDGSIKQAVEADVEKAPQPVDAATAVAVVTSVEMAVDEAVHDTVGDDPDPAAASETIEEVAEVIEEAVKTSVTELREDNRAADIAPHTALVLLDGAERAAAAAANRAQKAEVAHGVSAGLFETSTHVGGALAVAVLLSVSSAGAGFTGAYSAAAVMVLAAWVAVLVLLVPSGSSRRTRARVWSLRLSRLRRRKLVIRAASSQLAARNGPARAKDGGPGSAG